MYRDCVDAEKYNDVSDDDIDEVKNEKKEKTEDEDSESLDLKNKEHSSADVDEQEGAGDSQPNESDDSNSIRRKRNHKPFRNFIINRRISIIWSVITMDVNQFSKQIYFILFIYLLHLNCLDRGLFIT